MDVYELTVPEDEAGTRLDLFLAGELSVSRSRAHQLIEKNAVASPDVKKIRPALKIQAGQRFSVTWCTLTAI